MAWAASTMDASRFIDGRVHGCTNCPIDPAGKTSSGDGLLPVRLAAERLGVSTSLIHIWIQHGVLASDQRTTLSKRWVRLTEADMIRLDGWHDWRHFSTINQVMRKEGLSREQSVAGRARRRLHRLPSTLM